MDLQAILDAPSTSSSETFSYKNTNDYKSSYEDGLSDISSAHDNSGSYGLLGTTGSYGLQASSFRDAYRFTNNSYDSNDVVVVKRSNLELERILRDDDEDDEEDDLGVFKEGEVKKKKQNGSGGREKDILHSILNENDDEMSCEDESKSDRYGKRVEYFSSLDSRHYSGDASMRFSSQNNSSIPLSHSMEVDAILDAVGDDDDNDEQSENEFDSSYLKYQQRILSVNSINSDDEEEDEEGIGLNFNFSTGLRTEDNAGYDNIMSIQYPLSRGVPSQEEGRYDPEIYLHKTNSSREDAEQSLKEYTASFLHRHNTKSEKTTTSQQPQSLPTPLSEDQQTEQISNLCLQSAQHHEHRLLKPNNRNIISPLTVKRRMKPKVTLKSKSQQSTNTATMSQQPSFNFSGIIQVKSMANLSCHILKSNAQQSISQRDHGTSNVGLGGGLPTAMAVNSKFIAVGTQRGEIWIFDLFEQLKITLGESATGIGNRVHEVTSIDLPMNGDYLLAGYGSGGIILWDVIKGSPLKSIFDLHSSPITSVRLTSFPLGGNNDDIAAVTVDASGLVNKNVFSKGMLWSSYSVETECLLDGTAGQILAMDTLPPLDACAAEASDYHPSAYKIVLIALSSDRSSFAVSVVPKVSVLHRWAKPEAERIDPSAVKVEEGDGGSEVSSLYASTIGGSVVDAPSSPPERLPFLPCLSWGWGLVSGGKNSVTPILARSWGCCIQFLCANFPPRDENDVEQDDGTIHWPAFGLHDEFDVSAPVVSLNWLGTRSLVYLTLSNEFTIIDTVIMTMQERLDFSGIKLVYAEFALSRAKRSESKLCTTFMNSIRSNDNRLLVLCEEEVKQITVLGITEQISSLEEGGQWLEALALALDHYESTILSQEDRQRDATRDTMTLTDNSLLTEDEIWMAELLMRYLLLAIDNAPEPEITSGPTNKRLNLAQSHFEMLSGVCLEYCVTMKRLDLLFGPIFRCFYEARYINVFLDVMETYVLNDRLRYIAPEAMVLFVAHCKDMKDISMVERCLLHLECSLMDFDSILTLLKKNALYTGLLHVYSTGLDDYTSPLEVLFDAIFDSLNSSNCIHSNRHNEGILGNIFEQYGYKALMYLKYCFSGKSFPKGEQKIPNERVHILRSEIFQLLFHETVVVPPHQAHAIGTYKPHGVRASTYPYLRALILVDARAFLECLAIALDDPESTFDEAANIDVIGSWEVEVGTDHDRIRTELGQSTSSDKDPKLLPDRQYLVNILSSIFMTDDIVTFDNHFSVREPSKVTASAKNAFLDFLAKYLELGIFTAPRYLTAEVMTRICSKSRKATSEDRVLSLLKSLPRSSYELDDIIFIVERTHMTRSALFLYQTGVSRTIDRPSLSEKCQFYFNRTIDCFLKDADEEFRKKLFEYAKKECSGALASHESDGSGNSIYLMRRAILKRIPELVELDSIQTAQLVGELFVEDIDMILTSLQGIESGRVQYSFLRAIISDLPKIDTVAAQEIGANLTNEHQLIYLTLMARFQPEEVYSYLSTTNHSYRLEDALKLCQDRRITDGSAYLLERMGDVSGALMLMLQTLDTRMVGLKNIIQESLSGVPSRVNNISTVKASLQNNEAAQKELSGAKQTLSAVLDLCERNKNEHLILDNERGPLLWFHVLDRLVNAKHLLGASKNASKHHLVVISTILSELLLMTMQRMTHHVSHFDLMQKITGDHAGSDIGEFREMLVSMLRTYSSELDICSNAVNVMRFDIRNMAIQRKNLKVRGSFIQECSKPPSLDAVMEINPSRSFQVTAGRRNRSYNTRILPSSSSLSASQRKNDMIRGIRARQQSKRSKNTKMLNFMTASERHYASGNLLNSVFSYSFDDGGARQVGVLTEAQNVGGLF